MTDRPWMTALEMQFAALRTVRRYRDATEDSVRIFYEAVFHLSCADCFSFNAETATAISMAARTVPKDTVIQPAIFPWRHAWWWFDVPVTISGLHPETQNQCCAISWSLDVIQGEIGVWGWVLDSTIEGHRDPVAVFHERVIQRGSTLAELDAAVNHTDPNQANNKLASTWLWRWLIAGNVWLKQRVVTTSIGPVERHRRKQLAREYQVPLPSDVKVIQLRRVESPVRAEGSHGEPVEWSCRWIVNGHWRNQYHPSNGEHELQYILPHVKGPADKPLRIPSHTVYAVTR